MGRGAGKTAGGAAGGDDAGEGGATLTVGPTSEGMVRLLVEGDGVTLPMDFEPDEAEEIAGELCAAAARARQAGARKAPAPDRRRRR